MSHLAILYTSCALNEALFSLAYDQTSLSPVCLERTWLWTPDRAVYGPNSPAHGATLPSPPLIEKLNIQLAYKLEEICGLGIPQPPQ